MDIAKKFPPLILGFLQIMSIDFSWSLSSQNQQVGQRNRQSWNPVWRWYSLPVFHVCSIQSGLIEANKIKKWCFDILYFKYNENISNIFLMLSVVSVHKPLGVPHTRKVGYKIKKGYSGRNKSHSLFCSCEHILCHRRQQSVDPQWKLGSSIQICFPTIMHPSLGIFYTDLTHFCYESVPSHI